MATLSLIKSTISAIFSRWYQRLAEFFQRWSNHQCSLQAAAIAFYSAFSLAPTLVIIVAVASFFYGAEAAQGQLINQARDIVGTEAAISLQAMIANAWRAKMGAGATLMSILGIAIGASATFASLNTALNRIWPTEAGNAWSSLAALVRVRLMSFGLVIGSGFLIVVLLVLDAAMTIVSQWLLKDASVLFIGLIVQRILSLFILAAAFTALLKLLPDAPLSWSSACYGGMVAAILFSLGKHLFALYLSQAGTANAFGAAGSLAAILMWLYFSATIFLVGAEIAAMIEKSRIVKYSAPVG